MESPSSNGSVNQSRTTNIAMIVGALLLVAAGIYIGVLHKQLNQLRDESTRTIEAHLKTITLQTQAVDALDNLAARVEKFNREFGASLGQVQITDNLESNIKTLEAKDIPDQAKKTLDEFEKTLASVAEMQKKVAEYEKYLGTPVLVKRGENHASIARSYLVNEAKLTAKEADEVLKRTALAWELEPGNKVFNLYKDGILLSTVTQGDAKRAPLMAQLQQRRATSARIAELEEKIRQLEAKLAPAAQPAAAANDAQ